MTIPINVFDEINESNIAHQKLYKPKTLGGVAREKTRINSKEMNKELARKC